MFLSGSQNASHAGDRRGGSVLCLHWALTGKCNSCACWRGAGICFIAWYVLTLSVQQPTSGGGCKSHAESPRLGPLPGLDSPPLGQGSDGGPRLLLLRGFRELEHMNFKVLGTE